MLSYRFRIRLGGNKATMGQGFLGGQGDRGPRLLVAGGAHTFSGY